MAVLIEGISLIIKLEVIQIQYPGGWEQFKTDVPNQTLCCDSEIARVGFMSPEFIEKYVHFLESKGLVFQRDGKTIDMAVVDQQRGFTISCDWAEFGHINWEGDPDKRISACIMKNTKEKRVFTPDGWVFENSLSHNYTFCENDKFVKKFEFIGTDDSVAVYRERETGKKFYMGTTGDCKLKRTASNNSSLSLIDACIIVAKSFNNLDISVLQPYLAEDIRYTSQWVFDEMHSKVTFVDYLSHKFEAIRKSTTHVFAELARHGGENDYCLVIAQGTKIYLSATMLIKIMNNKISQIDMCMVPSPEECVRLGIYP